MRRRTVFATPFVVVLGCSHPTDRPAPVPHATVDDAAQGPVAASGSADHSSLPPIDRCKQEPWRAGCNPPAPDARVYSVVEGKVIRRDPQAGGVLFVVYLDESVEVTPKYKAVFVGERGVIEDPAIEIKNPQKRTITCFVANRTELPADRVRFVEPGGPP